MVINLNANVTITNNEATGFSADAGLTIWGLCELEMSGGEISYNYNVGETGEWAGYKNFGGVRIRYNSGNDGTS